MGSMKITTSEIQINAPAEKVWQALTDPALVKQWQYGSDLIINSWTAGEPLRFRNQWQETVFEQWGTVLNVAPLKEISYTLFAPQPGLEDKPENYFTMTYKLDDHSGKTTLTIIQQDPRHDASSDGSSSEDDEGGKAVLESLKNLVENAL